MFDLGSTDSSGALWGITGLIILGGIAFWVFQMRSREPSAEAEPEGESAAEPPPSRPLEELEELAPQGSCPCRRMRRST